MALALQRIQRTEKAALLSTHSQGPLHTTYGSWDSFATYESVHVSGDTRKVCNVQRPWLSWQPGSSTLTPLYSTSIQCSLGFTPSACIDDIDCQHMMQGPRTHRAAIKCSCPQDQLHDCNNCHQPQLIGTHSKSHGVSVPCMLPVVDQPHAKISRTSMVTLPTCTLLARPKMHCEQLLAIFSVCLQSQRSQSGAPQDTHETLAT